MRLYSHDGKPQAVLVDMDGTLVDTTSLVPLLRSGLRTGPEGLYDSATLDEYHRQATECGANWDIVDNVAWDWQRGLDVLILTARNEKYRKATERWLNLYCIPYVGLYMRAEDDSRSDAEVKSDWLTSIQDEWHVVSAFDDNPYVIKMLRSRGIRVEVVPGWVDQ